MKRAALICFGYGDVKWQTARCVTNEILHLEGAMIDYIAPDAAIDRVRSVVAMQFLAGPADVIAMCDRDIIFQPGDVANLVDGARLTKGIVAGIVAQKNKGTGYGSRMPDDFVGEIRTKQLVPMPEHSYCGGALMAIHREVFEKIIAGGMPKVAHGFYPFFEPTTLWNPDLKMRDALSEDWAICKRARDAGCDVHTSLWPLTKHIGDWGYDVFDANDQGMA